MRGKKNRWLTSVHDTNVRWGPSEHRNLIIKDNVVEKLLSPSPIQQQRTERSRLYNLSSEVYSRTVGKKHTHTNSEQNRAEGAIITIVQEQTDMYTIINHTVDTLTDVPKTTHCSRMVSQRTKDLFTKRTNLGRRRTSIKVHLIFKIK